MHSVQHGVIESQLAYIKNDSHAAFKVTGYPDERRPGNNQGKFERR